MCNRAILVLLIFILPSFTQAQLKIGLEFGLDKNKVNNDLTGRSFTENKASYGCSIGLPVTYKFTSWLALQSGINFQKKNYQIVRTELYSGIKEEFKNSYVQLPFTANFLFKIRKINYYLKYGIYGAIWCTGMVNGNIPNIFDISEQTNSNGTTSEYLNLNSFSDTYQFDSKKDKRLEFGSSIGTGVNYSINKTYSINLELRYDQSFTDQQKSYMLFQQPRYNRTFFVLIGTALSFHNP